MRSGTTNIQSTIVGRPIFEKYDRQFRAAFDIARGEVRVYEYKDVLRTHELNAHFAGTQSLGRDQIAEIITGALEIEFSPIETSRSTRTFTFMPTSRCNMGCAYCGQEHTLRNLGLGVGERFLQRVRHAFESNDISHVHVAWFGGEPLLAYRSILELSKEICEEADKFQKFYSSKITTNGALLTPDRLRSLVEDARVSRFDVTIDGPGEVHDRHRPLKSGRGSHQSIMRTLEWYRDVSLSRPALIVLRTNVDRDNIDAVLPYLDDMKSRGFDSSEKFLYELAPVHSWGNDVSAIALTTEEAADSEIQWMTYMERLGLPYGLLPGRMGDITCVATDRRSEVIGSDGRLFSCTETPLTSQATADTLGNIFELPLTTVRPKGQFDGWDDAVQAGAVPCSSCELKRICRGACPKQWREGSIPCPTLKLNFDRRLEIFMRRYGYTVAHVQ